MRAQILGRKVAHYMAAHLFQPLAWRRVLPAGSRRVAIAALLPCDDPSLGNLTVDLRRGPGSGSPRAVGLPPEDFVDRALVQRDQEEIAVGSGLDVGHDPEVPPDEQALTFGDVELVVVVSDPALQPRGLHG